MAFGKKKKKNTPDGTEEDRAVKRALSLEKKQTELPDKKREDPVEAAKKRRLAALEKRNNPTYNPPYEPAVDTDEVEEETIRNERFEKIADRIRIFKFIAVALLVIYIIYMAFTYRDLLTVENFRYLVRSVDLDVGVGLETDGGIVYDADPENLIIKFREYLAVIGSGKLRIFDGGGMESYSEDVKYVSPAVLTSDRYMLIYDRSGGGYSIYSCFDKQKSEDPGYPISAAAVSDSGFYAVAAPSSDYDGVVYVYNSSLKLINRVFKNKRVTSLALSGSGDELLITCLSTDERGQPVAEITLLPTSTGSSRLLFNIEGVVPCASGVNDDGSFWVASNDGIRVFDREGGALGKIAFDAYSASSYSASDDGFVLYCRDPNDSGKTICRLFSASAKEIFTADAGHGLIDAARSGDSLCALYRDRVIVTSPDGERDVYELTSRVTPLRIFCGEGVMTVCTETSVETLALKEKSRSGLIPETDSQ